jgi:hypothetical protein
MKKNILLGFLALWCGLSMLSAQVTIGADNAPQPFSVLELISGNDKGLRLPQLTQLQRDTLDGTTASAGGSASMIASAAAFATGKTNTAMGLTIFNITTKCVETWNGVKWIEQCAASIVPPFAPSASAHTLCAGATVANLTATAEPAHTLNWYNVATGGSPLASSTALIGGNYYVSQTNSYGLESTRTTVMVVIVPAVPSQPSAITGATAVCSGATGVTYSVTNVAGVEYDWNLPTGWTKTAGDNTNSITVNAGTTGGTITVTPSNTCGNGTPRTLPVTISIPSAPTASAQTFCGSTTVASLVPAPSATIKWYSVATGGTALTAGTAISTSGTYYAEAVSGSCASATRTSVAVTITAIPSAPTASAQTFCGATTVASLVPAPSATIKWYSVATGGTELATGTAISTSGTYYAEAVSGSCVSATRTSVAVTITSAPSAPTASAQTFCGATTVASLVPAPSATVKWYSVATGGTELATGTAISTSGTYYAEAVSGSCVSATRTSVAVTITSAPSAPTASAQTFCGATTVASLVPAPSATIKWYSVATGGTALTAATAISTSGTYYAEAVSGSCASATRTSVAVTITSVPAAPTASAQTFCGSTTVASLVPAPSATIKWYSVATGGTALTAGTAISTSGTYYAEAVSETCGVSATRTSVAVTITSAPSAPTASAQTFCGSTTVASLVPAPSATIKWYTVATGGTALTAATTISTSGTFYVEAVSGSCASATRTSVVVTRNLAPSQPSNIAGHPFVYINEAGLTYSVINVSGVTYNWTVPTDWVITSGTGTNSITVTAGTTGGTITVTPSNVNCGNGTPRTLDVTTTVPLIPPAQGALYWTNTKWVGAFWRDSQTGERIIAAKNYTAWTASVDDASGTGSWLTLDANGSFDPNLWTGTPGDAESFQLPSTRVTSVSGGGDILFRIGATSTNPAATTDAHKYPDGSNGKPPRYATVNLNVGGINYKIHCRQGEAADYVFTTSDTYGASLPRDNARKFSPYNLTGASLNETDNLAYSVGARGGSFVDFPTKAGAFFQWAANPNTTYAYHPTKPTGVPTGWNYSNDLIGYWDAIKTVHETCPTGWRRPNDGSTGNEETTGDIAGSEMRQSLFAVPKAGYYSMTETTGRAWGFYADGYFDRRPIVNSVVVSSKSAVNHNTKDVAYIGTVLFNANIKNSLFVPASGFRDSAGLFDTGFRGFFYSSSVSSTDRGRCISFGSDQVSGNAFYLHAASTVRCVSE